MSHPLFKGIIFALIPLSYYFLDVLNYAQAGKSAILGGLVLTTLFYWQALLPKQKLINYAILFSTFIILAFMVFQAALRDIFGVEQDSIIVIEALFNTNPAESKEFLLQYQRQLISHIFLLCLLLATYLIVTLKLLHSPTPLNNRKSLRIGCCIFTLLTILIHLNPTARRANPLFFFPMYYQEWTDELAMTKQLSQYVKDHVSVNLSSMKVEDTAQSRTLVWVIGESDTRNNWGLYGYSRQTTPQLSALKHELITFTQVKAAGGATIGSITKMLTPASQQQPELWHSQPDILSIAAHAGYKTFWLSNQATDGRGVLSIFAHHADSMVLTNKGTARGEGSFDEVLFKPYEQALNDPAPRKLIIVHIMGAHPAYNFRYPEHYAQFDNTVDDQVAKTLKAQGRSFYAITFRNQYDNALLYQDYVLAGLLNRLKDKQLDHAAWLYIADHGQDVSHHSDFSGHNQKAAEQWQVPMIFWSKHPHLNSASITLADTVFQADHLNHSLLGLMHIKGYYYDKRLDIFNQAP